MNSMLEYILFSYALDIGAIAHCGVASTGNIAKEIVVSVIFQNSTGSEDEMFSEALDAMSYI